MGNCIDLTGQKFGRLVVIERSENGECGNVRWVCCCDCGEISVVGAGALRTGATKSCGCLNRELTKRRFWEHGEAVKGEKTREYRIWTHIKGRCLNPRNDRFKNYGGRGITVCDRWLKYENFLEDMGRCPKGLSIERIDNNGNYEPGNCKWATMHEQSRNMRTNVWMEYKGKRMILEDWLKKLGISWGRWNYWKNKGMSFTDFLDDLNYNRGGR